MQRKRKHKVEISRPLAPGRVEPADLERRQFQRQAAFLLRDVGGVVLIVLVLALLGALALSGLLRFG